MVRVKSGAAPAIGALLLSLALPMAAKPLVVCDDVKDPMTLDPQREFSEKNHTIVQQIFEGLVRFGPEGGIEPALATEWKRLDDRTMQFKLRRGVVFHDGEPFKADSVKFSIERYLDPATGFPAFGYINSLDHVDVIDDYTVNVVTKYSDGLLLNRLAGFIMIVPLSYRGRAPEFLREHPVGTGAFHLNRWEHGRQLVLDANPDYWRLGFPKASQLVFRFLPYDRQIEALLKGDVDVLTNVPGTRTLDVQQSTGAYVVKKPSLYTMAGNFNLSRKPLSDKRVREALNLAVDREELIRYDIFGNGLPIATLGLPDEFGTDASLKPYPYDIEKAKALLSQAGYGKGFSLKALLKVNAERTGRILAKQLSRIGVKLEFTLVTDAELFEFLKDRSRWDMAIYSCPDPMYHAYFIRSIFLAGSSPFSLYPDPGIDSRLDALIRTIDAKRQERISKELDDYISSEFLALPTYQRLGVYGVRRGVRFTPYKSGMPYFFATGFDGAKENR